MPKKHILQIIIVSVALISFYLTCLAQNGFPVDDPEFIASVERYRERIRKDQKNLELHRKMVKHAKNTDRMNVPFYIYKESYKKHPKHPVVLYALGYTYLIDGKKESLEFAEKYLSKAVDKDSKMADARAALGACYLKQGKVQKAGEELKTSIRLNSKLVPGYVGLGDYYRTKGKYKKAIKSYSFALDYDPKSFEAYLGLGITYFAMQTSQSAPQSNEGYDTAIEKLKLAITLNESSIEAHRFLGKTYAWSGKSDMAMEEYDLSMKKVSSTKDPVDRAAWYELANVFLDANNNEYALKAAQRALPPRSALLSNVKIGDAVNILEDILVKRPNDVELRHFLGRLYLVSDNLESAKQHLEKVRDLEPDNKEIHMELGRIYEEKNEPGKAAKEYQEATKLGSEDTSILEKVANKHFEDNNIEKFINIAEKIVSINSQNADIHYKLSIAYERKHNILKKDKDAEPDEIIDLYDLAVDHCKKAIELATSNSSYHLRLADLYAKEGKLKALREYKDAIELAPKNALGYYHRARFMANFKFGSGFLLWSPEDILNDLQKAISLDPKLAGAYSTLGKMYDRMDEVKKAIETYETAVQLDPSIVEAQLYLAEKYADQNPQKAIEAFRSVIDSGMNNVEVLKDYAFLILKYDEKRKWKKAQMALEKALESVSNDTEILMNYGYTLYLEEKYPEAIEYYQKVLESEPDNTRTLYNLAIAYERVGQLEEALQTWKKVLQLDPEGRYGDTASDRIQFLNETLGIEED